MDKQDRKELKEIAVATFAYTALVGMAFGGLGLLAGCDATYSPKPGQLPRECIALDGSDRFAFDPNDEQTSVSKLSGTYYLQFTDTLTGYTRVVRSEDLTRYACKGVRRDD